MSETIAYKEYTLENIFETTDAAVRQEVIDFWVNNNVLPLEIATQRVAEVVHVFRNREKEIIGVNTAYLHALTAPSEMYYFIRMFIRKEDRHSPGLMMIALLKTFVFFRDSPIYSKKGKGIVLAIENKKFTQQGLQKWLKRHGLNYVGKNELGQDLWFARFDDPSLQNLQ